jgi:signal transduction histidine kinase
MFGLLFVLYRMRLGQLRKQYNISLEARVSERTRIARDLHDTLLQSFQGVLLKFHALTYVILDRPAEARKGLESAIEEAREAIAEGRDAVQGLRSSTTASNDLTQALSTLGDRLADESTEEHSADFHLLVEGAPRNLAPLVGDEIYSIAAEAIRNAFSHAHAARIEVEVHFDVHQLRLRVRDNGRGIDPQVLQTGGSDGHYGLKGMQERAKAIGGMIAVWSELGSGTEVELSIPATAAYSKSLAARRPAFWRKGA